MTYKYFKENTYTLLRTTHPSLTPSVVVPPTVPSYGVVHVGVGYLSKTRTMSLFLFLIIPIYIDTVRLNSADIDKALDTVKDQACLVSL